MRARAHTEDNKSHPKARYVVGVTIAAAAAYATEAGHDEASFIPIDEASQWPLDEGDVVVVRQGQDTSPLWYEFGQRAQQVGAIVKGR